MDLLLLLSLIYYYYYIHYILIYALQFFAGIMCAQRPPASVIKTNQLILCRVIMAVCSEIHKKTHK